MHRQTVTANKQGSGQSKLTNFHKSISLEHAGMIERVVTHTK